MIGRRSTSPRRAFGLASPLVAAAVVVGLTGQGPTAQRATARQGDRGRPQRVGSWIVDFPYSRTIDAGDVQEIVFAGGFRLTRGDAVLQGSRGVAVLDKDLQAELVEMSVSDDGLPRRGTRLPAARRRIDRELLRRRLASLLVATGKLPEPARDDAVTADDDALAFAEKCRSIYLEGDVVLERDGREVLRAGSFFYSVVDDRGIFDDVILRLSSPQAQGPLLVYTLRAPRLVREGGRITGSEVSITTCEAGQPHFEVYSGEIEIIERTGAFEVRSRGNRLRFGGRGLSIPLPNVSFFTDDQNQIPVKSAAVRYSRIEGAQVDVLFGSNFNRVGGAVHEAITGRDASEFRGEWEFGVGFNEFRGVPLDARLFYRAPELYDGYIEAFHLDDQGRNLREIRRNFDGSLITENDRAYLRSETRVFLPGDTTLDLTVFEASDPAVYSEFFSEKFYGAEIPETSIYLRNQQSNRLATVNARWNLAGFSYADDRSLARSFLEQLPVATYDVFSQPLFEIARDTPVTLTSSTSVGQLRNNVDNDVFATVDDRTLRADQEFELAVQSRFLGLGVRPFASARAIHYDGTPAPDEGGFTRGVFEAGVQVGTKLQRTFRWTDADGGSSALRHVIHPTFEFSHVYKADRSPDSFHEFDRVDRIDENARMRIGLLQRFLTPGSRVAADRTGRREEVLWLDLAQNVFPISERDNAGDRLGLFEFEAILQPSTLVPLPRSLQFVFEGEYDWGEEELRTFNSFVSFDVERVNLFTEYRTDRTEDGTLLFGAQRPFFDRWTVIGRSRYDLETEQFLAYSTQLVRRDHDWNLRFAVNFDFVSGQTTFNILVEPKFGGIVRPRRQTFYTASDLRATDF